MLDKHSKLRDTRQSSKYLFEVHGVRRTPATLAKLRVLGTGPEFVKVGSRDVAYSKSSLDVFAQGLISRPMRSTSEAA